MKTRMNKENCIESLRFQVVCPAKTKVLFEGEERVTLVSSNYRFRGRDEKSIWDWYQIFKEADLDFKIELMKLVKQELGENFYIRKRNYSGYLGVTSDTWFEVVKRYDEAEISKPIEELLTKIAEKSGGKEVEMREDSIRWLISLLFTLQERLYFGSLSGVNAKTIASFFTERERKRTDELLLESRKYIPEGDKRKIYFLKPIKELLLGIEGWIRTTKKEEVSENPEKYLITILSSINK